MNKKERMTHSLDWFFAEIIKENEIDDYRELFKMIHIWGYYKDFTGITLTDVKKNGLKMYLDKFMEETK